MSFIPLNFTSDEGGGIRTIWQGGVVGWQTAEARRRFEGAVSNSLRKLLDKPASWSFTPELLRFPTRSEYEGWTRAFPQGSDSDVIVAALRELGADVDAIRVDLADEEPAGEPPPA